MNGNFDINSMNPTNKDITIVFSPSNNVVSYTYQIYKDNVPVNTTDINNNAPSNIVLSETGIYKINVHMNLINGTSDDVQSGEYIIDKEAPIINISQKQVTTTPTKAKNLITCTANDNYSGNLSDKITSNIDEISFDKTGNYTYKCTVQDEAGNRAVNTATINVVPHSTTIYVIQIICMIIAFVAIVKIIKIIKAIKIENRLDSYVIEPLKDDTLTASEKLRLLYSKFLDLFTSKLKKSVIATKYAKRLDKYIPVSGVHKNGYDILSGKIIIACALTILVIIVTTFQFKLLGSLETLGVFTLGFFVLDIYLFVKYKVFRWTLESDFIAAITIMNNSFKSGRSISQAIEIVSTEVSGVIGTEFKRMKLELSYGLDIEQVFKRFAQRIDLEEASYLTASLTILNKTGGDIIKVFSSIERSLFDKRKLRLELKSLTSGSRIIVYILLGIPFLFVLVISLINPGYFLPFITTNIGRILLIFMIIYYIIFVVVVRKIMKVVIWWKKKPNSFKKYTVKRN